MAATPQSFKNDYVADATPSSSDLDRRANFIGSQVPGALDVIGFGIVRGLLVTDAGSGQVNISAGSAIVNDETYGAVRLDSPGALVTITTGDHWLFIALPDGDPFANYPLTPQYLPELSGDALNGGQLLAKVTNTSGTLTITDLRAFIGGAGLLGDIVPNGGRVVGADPTILEPQETGSPSLNVALPAGSIYDISNQRVKLGADVFIIAPASFTGYGFLSLDPDSGEPTVTSGHWYATYPTGADLAALRAAGLPCLGHVTTSLTAVTAIDPSATTGKADLIYTQAGLLALIEGGGAPDVSALMAQVAALTAQLADLQAQMNLLNSSSVQGAAPDLSNIYSRLAIGETELAKTQVAVGTVVSGFRPTIVEAVPGVTIVGGAGDGQHSTPDGRGVGNMSYNTTTGAFTP